LPRGLADAGAVRATFLGAQRHARYALCRNVGGLPNSAAPAPFWRHILSHDYVEAALLVAWAAGAWKWTAHHRIVSKKAPDNLSCLCRRDRRVVPSNLQQ